MSFKTYWENFNATAAVGKDGDGSEATDAELQLTSNGISWKIPGKTNAPAKFIYTGTAGLQATAYEDSAKGVCGHAEMAALHRLIYLFDTYNHNFDNATNRIVFCTSKPVCCRCSVVLGFLNFGASGTTLKSKYPMGSTEWGTSSKVQEFLNARNFDGTVSKLAAWTYS